MDRDTLLVVVGAGASYACQDGLLDQPKVECDGRLPTLDASDTRPPLTQALVGPGKLQDAMLAPYSAARPLVAELRAALDTGDVVSFEEMLAGYERSAADNPARERHLLALRFYLRDLLWACTLYATEPTNGSGLTRFDRLVNELQHWAARHDRHVCIVNFNYDLILETACRDVFRLDPFKFESYLANPHVSVVKPHGSVNWAWHLTDSRQSMSPERFVIEHARGLEVEPESLHTTSRPYHGRPKTYYRVNVPALALPVAEKHDFVWPAEQHAFVEGLRSNVRAVITLGWRGLEPHFLDLLPPLVRKASALLVTGGPHGEQDGRELRNRLVEKAQIVRCSFHPDGLPPSLQPCLDWFDRDIDWRQPA